MADYYWLCNVYDRKSGLLPEDKVYRPKLDLEPLITISSFFPPCGSLFELVDVGTTCGRVLVADRVQDRSVGYHGRLFTLPDVWLSTFRNTT